ncbi:hypothetical protein EF847_10510 [Actinobacteria bacterium YIM 96077]|uniref:L-tyrosine 3-hydroxylase n=1 Tax=Phytoactinopolyspora halophila TaxID=1981511 RepID=A0A329QAZ6_9ACTN|nr:hypothetical protein [Phytoactinopolyspora halophila]AYY13064.1 hypothetical protein EF847_10510 [Actinobacteria bacterium YIM 96077]RAW09241.1 hypothetical protein DPM12_22110 [Phytoactinopolyspora halophila]
MSGAGSHHLGTVSSYPDHRCRRVPAASIPGQVDDLVLTMPGEPFSPCSGEPGGAAACDQPIDADLCLLHDAARGACPTLLSPPSDLNERTRYRWLVGHHAVVAIWQSQTRLLRLLANATRPTPGAVRAVARLYDTYSLLFLYAGSCSARRYADTVRADMYAHHPAFSGQWGRDYEPIPQLLRRLRRTHSASFLAPLVDAAKLNHRVHVAIANKLVPAGGSLLRDAGRKPGDGPSDHERDLFDSFFRIRRGPSCQRAYIAQTIRRIAHVAHDICEHGVNDPDSSEVELSTSDARAVQHIEENATRVLLHGAEIVTSLDYHAVTIWRQPALARATA